MAEIPPHLRRGLSDSAGQPWEGRTFSDNPFQDDDGTAPEALALALQRFRAGEAPPTEIVDALRDTRVLIPLVAELGEEGENEHGVKVDKSAELSIVTVKSPDGRGIVPIFSSVAAMRRWDAQARPIPVDSRRAALAAVDEGSELLILDPGSKDTEFVVRRPMVWAIARDTPYALPWLDETVLAHAQALMNEEPRLLGIDLAPGDADSRFAGPELEATILVATTLGEQEEREVLQRVQQHVSSAPEIIERVDSLILKVERVAQETKTQGAKTAPFAGLFRRRKNR